jgi:hypothetical protein
VWSILCVLSYFNPGDEYGLFGIGAIIGSWIGFFLHTGSLQALFIASLVTGFLIMFGLSFIMEQLQINKKLFAALFTLAFIAYFIISIINHTGYEDIGAFEKMRYKNGSVFAVIVAVSHFSLYTAVFLSIIVAGIKKMLARAKS